MESPAGFAAAVATTPTPTVAVTIATTAATATTASSATATATGAFAAAAAAAAGAAGIEPPGAGGNCQLLGPFSLVVQAVLGWLALLSLVYKRWKERPQRPVKIWFFDVSKQVFGSVLVHTVNVFMSMVTSGKLSVQAETSTAGDGRRWVVMMMAARGLGEGDGEGAGSGGGDEGYTPNPCSFYFLNLAIDTTIGIPILIGLLKLCTVAVSYTPLGTPPESIQSGNYGHPPNAWWWLKQSLIYFVGLFGMKLIVLFIFVFFPWISHVGDWALSWTEGNEQLQIFFVMMFFPLIMNGLQYYVIDSFIKKAETGGDHHQHQRLPEEDPDWALGNAGGSPYDDYGVARGLFDSSDEDSGDDDEDDGTKSTGGSSVRLHHHQQKQQQPNQTQTQTQTQKREEYDPDLDGDAPTIVGSSASSRRADPRTSQVPQELYPKE